jgi:hypothetical protein
MRWSSSAVAPSSQELELSIAIPENTLILSADNERNKGES